MQSMAMANTTDLFLCHEHVISDSTFSRKLTPPVPIPGINNVLVLGKDLTWETVGMTLFPSFPFPWPFLVGGDKSLGQILAVLQGTPTL